MSPDIALVKIFETKKQNFRMKLSIKYAATILALVFCIVIAFASVILIQFRSEISRLNARSAETLRQSVLKEIRDKEIIAVRVMASALTNPLYQVDMLKINELVAAVNKQPDILYVYVYDSARKIVHDGTENLESYGKVLDDPLTMESMETRHLTTQAEGDTFHVAAPIRIQNEIVGGVKIGYSAKSILSDVKKREEDLAKNYHSVATNQLYAIIVLAIGFSICGLVVAVFVGRSWSNPITLLSDLTARVGQGDYDVSIPGRRSDEIGRLALSFNEMVVSLKRLRDREVAQSKTLRDTNQELHRANAELTNQMIERQQAQKELLEQNRRMHVLHEINSAISSILDRKMLLETLFDKIEALLPYSAMTVRLLDEETKQLLPVAARNLEYEVWREGLEGHTTIGSQGIGEVVFQEMRPLEIEDVQTDPRVLNHDLFRRHQIVSCLSVPMIGQGGVLGVLTFYLHEKHQFEKDEIDFLLTLTGEVAVGIYNSQLYEKIKNQAQELESANMAKDEFLSMMSHELRTPLNVINGYTEVLSAGMLGEVQPQQVQALKTIDLQSKTLLRMINEVLQIGSIQAGKITAKMESVDLSNLIDELRASCEVLSNKAIPVTWNVPAILPVVRTDSAKLKHIFQNLLNNAIKFTEEGSINVKVWRVGERLQIEVKDTGIGISKEDIATIFQMFRQVDSSGTRSYGGAGVGLYIVKQFVELLKGTIKVESTVGKGSIFTVVLPLVSVDEGDFATTDYGLIVHAGN